MLRCSVACVLVALAVIGAEASAQSRCAGAKVSEDVFEQRTEFAVSVLSAKSIFVGVYHNPASVLIDPPPPDSIEKVSVGIRKWPLVSKDEEGMLRSIRIELSRWGRCRIESDVSKADLILIAKPGRNKSDPVPRSGYFPDIPFLWDDSLHLYAPRIRPGLIWCGNQAGGLHLGRRGFPLLNKLEADVYGLSKPT